MRIIIYCCAHNEMNCRINHRVQMQIMTESFLYDLDWCAVRVFRVFVSDRPVYNYSYIIIFINIYLYIIILCAIVAKIKPKYYYTGRPVEPGKREYNISYSDGQWMNRVLKTTLQWCIQMTNSGIINTIEKMDGQHAHGEKSRKDWPVDWTVAVVWESVFLY